MDNNRMLKYAVFGMMNGTGITGRQHTEWLDYVRDWYKVDMHKLSLLAHGRSQWRNTVRHLIDTNG